MNNFQHQSEVFYSFVTWLLPALLLNHCYNKVLKVVVIFFKGVAIAQNAKEGVIGRKLFVVHFLWAIEPFVGKEAFCLFGLVSFEERIKLVAPPRNFIMSSN